VTATTVVGRLTSHGKANGVKGLKRAGDGTRQSHGHEIAAYDHKPDVTSVCISAFVVSCIALVSFTSLYPSRTHRARPNISMANDPLKTTLYVPLFYASQHR
jgi:hypothetical protein